LSMRKKQKRPEPEVHELIVREAKYRVGCNDFEPSFTLHRTDPDPTLYPSASWDVHGIRDADTWASDCAQAFKEAVDRARRKFDIEWRSPEGGAYCARCSPGRG